MGDHPRARRIKVTGDQCSIGFLQMGGGLVEDAEMNFTNTDVAFAQVRDEEEAPPPMAATAVPAPAESWWRRYSREIATAVVAGLIIAGLTYFSGWS